MGIKKEVTSRPEGQQELGKSKELPIWREKTTCLHREWNYLRADSVE
jgi:hypothetical protein